MYKKLGNLFKGDKVIWMVFFILCLVSIIEVFSASSSLTYKTANYWGPILRHIMMIFIGLALMIVIHNVKCKYFKIVTFPLLLASVIMLIAVLIFGESTNGANRWFSIFGIQFQPSEIAKGSLILAVAQILSTMQTPNGATKQAMYFVIGTSAVIILPIAIENLSTAALISLVVLLMMWVGRVPNKELGQILGIGVIGICLGLAALLSIPEPDDTAQEQTLEEVTTSSKTTKETSGKKKSGGILHRALTWKHRITNAFSGEEVAPEDYDLDKDSQVAHANIAIVKSNAIGRGPGNSEERDYLSQAFSDFIYAIIIEELGLEGAALVAILYVIIFWRAGRIARNCANTFPAYLAMGIGMLLVIQAMFNMMVAVGLAPVTGQPLPLISRGGTSTIINCVYLGMLLSISKSAKKRDQLTPAVGRTRSEKVIAATAK